MQVLEDGLRRRLDRRPVGWRARKLGAYSSHPIWRLQITLDDGRRLPIIFKDLQPDPRKAVGREVLLYERLLGGGRFGAPLLYASRYDQARDCYWLFIEDIGKWRLDWCEAVDWEPAFRRMARMHAAFLDRADELAALDCLAEHERPFYLALAADARGSLRAHGRPAALARFERLVDRFLEPAIANLEVQPRTLVHGDLSCHNVMVEREAGDRLKVAGIRPIDWEWAAIGVPAWDVAKLLAGWGSRKREFLKAYSQELRRCSGSSVDPEALQASVTLCGVMQKLWYLRWWIEPCRDPAFVDRLLDKVERCWEQVI